MRTAVVLVILTLFAPAVGATAVARVTLEGGGAAHHFNVEIAATPAARSRGLMHRTELGADAGMLFVFERPVEVSFWMRNTLIPLDLLFIDRRGRVVRIHPEAQPLDETLIPSGSPITHVLEINGGLAAELGIEPGHRMRIQSGE